MAKKPGKKKKRKVAKDTTIKKGERLSTREKKQVFLTMFKSKAANISVACEAAHIARKTYYRWLKNPKFKQKCDEILDGLIDYAESALIIAIKRGSLGAICYFLNNKGKRRGWQQPTKIEAEISDDVPKLIRSPLDSGPLDKGRDEDPEKPEK